MRLVLWAANAWTFVRRIASVRIARKSVRAKTTDNAIQRTEVVSAWTAGREKTVRRDRVRRENMDRNANRFASAKRRIRNCKEEFYATTKLTIDF